MEISETYIWKCMNVGSATSAECSTVERVTVDSLDLFKNLFSWDDKQSLFRWKGILSELLQRRPFQTGLALWRGSYRCILVMRDYLILFSVKRKFRKLFFVIRDPKVLHDPQTELELFTDIRDFTTQFYVILRRGSSERLDSSFESDSDMRFAIWSLNSAFHGFSFFRHSFWCKRTDMLLKESTLLAYFRDSWKRNFYISDPWSSIFSVRGAIYPFYNLPITAGNWEHSSFVLGNSKCPTIQWRTIASKVTIILIERENREGLSREGVWVKGKEVTENNQIIRTI